LSPFLAFLASLELTHRLKTQTQDAIKIQQLNELLITEVCKKKFLEEELEKERRQRDEYITDVIAQVGFLYSLSPSLTLAHSSSLRRR
jgi:hypothetical protein